MPVSQKIEYWMQWISVNLTNDCDGNKLDYSNDLPAIGNKNYAKKTFRNRFFDSNRQRKTPTVIRHLLSNPRQPTTLWPKAPDFELFFLCKIICNNYFIVKFIKMYSVIFTWINGCIYQNWKFSFANFNREKVWTNNLILSFKNEVYFFKKGNPIFSIKFGRKLLNSFSQLHV